MVVVLYIAFVKHMLPIIMTTAAVWTQGGAVAFEIDNLTNHGSDSDRDRADRQIPNGYYVGSERAFTP
jgi:hypothetical protein